MNLPKMRLWQVKPLLRSTPAYIAAVNTGRFLEGQPRILVVGDAGGRDWRYLQKLGKEVYTLDLSPQDQFPNLVVQSIEDRTPFTDGFFDGVVMNEVLEHLFRDVDALEEVRRILKPNGILAITIPYLSNNQDVAEWHVRVHSPRTIRRLLERCGFRIEEHFCRGFASMLPQFNAFSLAGIYLSEKLVEVLARKKPDDAVATINGSLEKLERFLGSHSLTMSFQRLFPSYGGVIKARSIATKRDFADIQRTVFSHCDIYQG